MTRNANPAFLTALANAPRDGLDIAKFFYVKAKSRGPSPVPFEAGFWTGDYDYTVTVQDSETGNMVSRVYYGVGVGLRIPKIPRTSDMTIQTLMINIPKNHPVSLVLVRENTVRLAKCDVHEGIIQRHGVTLVSPPELTFLGEVDGDPISRPAAGGSGSLTLECVSDAIRSLTRTNPARNSHERQVLRGGDQFALYSNMVENIKAPWGEVAASGGNEVQQVRTSAR